MHKAVDSTFQVASVASVPVQQLLKTVLLADANGAVLVSLPADQGLDFEALNGQLKRQLSLALAKHHQEQLLGFPAMMLPPWHRLYKLDWVVEESLLDLPCVYLSSGANTALFKMQAEDFARMSSDATVTRFGRRPRQQSRRGEQDVLVDVELPAEDVLATQSFDVLTTQSFDVRLHERIAAGATLPAMPDLAADLLVLKSRGDADVLQTAHLLEQDPVLSANLLRYAASPYFSYQGALLSVKEAINHVLGVEQALDMSIALCLCKHFSGPKHGVLGVESLWRDAFNHANICQHLGSLSDANLNPSSCYLSGLLHNIGYLLLAQLFPAEYKLFNSLVSQQDARDVADLEMRTLGYNHQEAGKTLLADWGLSGQLQVAAGHHHDETYRGEHAVYARLVGIADHLLAEMDMGDISSTQISADSLALCGLTAADLDVCRQTVLLQRDSLDSFARQVAGI